jgi:hypothetical protein
VGHSFKGGARLRLLARLISLLASIAYRNTSFCCKYLVWLSVLLIGEKLFTKFVFVHVVEQSALPNFAPIQSKTYENEDCFWKFGSVVVNGVIC